MFNKKEEQEKGTDASSLSGVKGTTPTLEELETEYKSKHPELQSAKRGRKPKANVVQDKLEEDLFQPDIWKDVASLPFHIRQAMTGSEIFKLTPEQEKSLGTPLALILKMLIDIDIKYLALAAFSINLCSIWAEKEILYNIQKKKEKKDAKIGT